MLAGIADGAIAQQCNDPTQDFVVRVASESAEFKPQLSIGMVIYLGNDDAPVHLRRQQKQGDIWTFEGSVQRDEFFIRQDSVSFALPVDGVFDFPEFCEGKKTGNECVIYLDFMHRFNGRGFLLRTGMDAPDGLQITVDHPETRLEKARKSRGRCESLTTLSGLWGTLGLGEGISPSDLTLRLEYKGAIMMAEYQGSGFHLVPITNTGNVDVADQTAALQLLEKELKLALRLDKLSIPED